MTLLREPLVHFFLIGFLLFGLDRAFSKKQREPQLNYSIHTTVGSAIVSPKLSPEILKNQAIESFTAANGRPPSAEELTVAANAWLDEEALFREGLRLKLDQDDPGVRLRVIEKAQSVLQAQILLQEPTENELRSHFDAHQARWDKPALLDFIQVYIQGDDANAKVRAEAILVKLQEGGDPTGLGDSFSGGRRYRGRSLESLREAFGDAFTLGLADAPVKQWRLQKSRFGFHLIQITDRTPAEKATFSEVREDVAADLYLQRRSEALSKSIKMLRSKYELSIQ